jgi:hypothetical protein
VEAEDRVEVLAVQVVYILNQGTVDQQRPVFLVMVLDLPELQVIPV